MLKILEVSAVGVKWLYDTKQKLFITETADGERLITENQNEKSPYEALSTFTGTIDTAWRRRIRASEKKNGEC